MQGKSPSHPSDPPRARPTGQLNLLAPGPALLGKHTQESPPERWEFDSGTVPAQHTSELLSKQKAASSCKVWESASGTEEQEKTQNSQPLHANWIKEQLLSNSGAMFLIWSRSHAFCLLLGDGSYFQL